MSKTAPPLCDPRFLLPRGLTDENPKDIGYWALIAEDLATHGGKWSAQGFWALFCHRFGNWRMGVRAKALRAPLTLLYRVWAKLVQMLGGIDLPYPTKVGRRVTLEHFGGMVLVAVSIGDGAVIRQNTTFGVKRPTPGSGNPIIGAGADIGVGAVIVGPVEIGAGATVGANAVVLADVPAGALAVGVPARIIAR